MAKLKYLLIIILGLYVFLLSPKPVIALEPKAEEPKAVINEVMANPQGTDSGHEWFEIANLSPDELDLFGWSVAIYNDPENPLPTKTLHFTDSLVLPGNGFLIVVNNQEKFRPVPEGNFFDGGAFTITNSKGKIELFNLDRSFAHELSWQEDIGEGYTMEIVGSPRNPNYSQWSKSLLENGTPGKINSLTSLAIPKAAVLVSPSNDFQSEKTSLDFRWQSETPDLSYDFYLSQEIDFTFPIVSMPALKSPELHLDDLDVGRYFWKVISTNGLDEVPSLVGNFEITKPVYSSAIMINEFCPNPTGESSAEWIELYNNSSLTVDLSGWSLEDVAGSIHRYVFPLGTKILPFGFFVLSRVESGITLNNDSDGLRLFQPDDVLLDQTPLFEDSGKGLSLARAPGQVWQWTTTLTPGWENLITELQAENPQEIESSAAENNQTEPIGIKTGEAGSNLDKLISITGVITQTEGDTFYLDDGSGEVKVYIQEKTQIDKPPMHQGDTFTIIGWVNVYRNVLRILPRYQADVKLVSLAKEPTKVTSTKTAKAKKTATTIAGSTAKAIAGTIKKAEASDSAAPNQTTKKIKTPLWLQILEMILAIATVVLIFVLLRLRKLKRMLPGARDFGGDFT